MTEKIEEQAEEYITKEYCENCIWKNACNSQCEKVKKCKQDFYAGAKWGMEHATQWHNLKENPDDLPKKENQDDEWSDVIRVKDTCGAYLELQYCFEYKTWHKAYDTVFEFPSIYIVAWCYSPTYKE